MDEHHGNKVIKYHIWFQITCVNYFSSPLNWYWQSIQYLLIWDALCVWTPSPYIELMIVDTISDLSWIDNDKYLIWNDSWFNICWFKILCVCELLLLTIELIMIVETISDFKYPVQTTSPHHWLIMSTFVNCFYQLIGEEK